MYPLTRASLCSLYLACQAHSHEVSLNALVKHISKAKLKRILKKTCIPASEKCKCFQVLEPANLLKYEITFSRASPHQDLILNVTLLLSLLVVHKRHEHKVSGVTVSQRESRSWFKC